MVQLKRAQQLQKKYHDKCSENHNLKSFNEDDWIMFFDGIRYNKARKKFLTKYFGHFIVEKAWGNFTYDIKKLGVRHFDQVNHNKLKLFHQKSDFFIPNA